MTEQKHLQLYEPISGNGAAYIGAAHRRETRRPGDVVLSAYVSIPTAALGRDEGERKEAAVVIFCDAQSRGTLEIGRVTLSLDPNDAKAYLLTDLSSLL